MKILNFKKSLRPRVRKGRVVNCAKVVAQSCVFLNLLGICVQG